MLKSKAALVIGIDAYEDNPLNVCTHDATEIAATLCMPEYDFSCRQLLDSQATRRAIKENLVNLFNEPHETYLFYFAGHGWVTDLGVSLITFDGDEIEPGIELDVIKKLVDRVPDNSSVLIVLDCCHSGAAKLSGSTGNGITLMPNHLTTVLPPFAQGRAVLAACREDQKAIENVHLGHGIFTSHLLNGLLGKAVDEKGEVSVHSLYDYVSTQMSTSQRQVPVFRGDTYGKLILGTGFPPVVGFSIPEDQAQRIEYQGESLLHDYQMTFGSRIKSSIEWRASGYKECCQKLEPILEWFERKLSEHPPLRSRKTFIRLKEQALEKRAYLCHLENGMVTPKGEASKKLGGGTFGTVWEVNNNDSSKFAYKVYHYSELEQNEKIKRFKRGYDAMKRLDHPYIVKVHDFTNCPLGFYMDFISGGNFRDFTGALEDPKEIVAILLTIAETLNHAHKRGVVHRDVKPENIIISLDTNSSQWKPYLTDFDLAWFSTASQMTKEALGTWHYSAPEQQAKPQSNIAHAPTVDSYSFGQLLFFSITGSDPIPFGYADNQKALKDRMRTGWTQESAQLFVELYSQCTDREPGKRLDFETIHSRLLRIYQLLKDLSPSVRLPKSKFIEELIFSMIGLSSENLVNRETFLTTLKKTEVNISSNVHTSQYANLVYDFRSQGDPIIEGITDFETLRRTLLSRIEEVLRSFPNTKKKNGGQRPFQVYVSHEKVPLTLDGVEESRLVISKVIDIIEGIRG